MSEQTPITFTTSSTVIEPKRKVGRSKKNASASTTTTTNTTTITITPKFIDMDSNSFKENYEGSGTESVSTDHKLQNEIIYPSEKSSSKIPEKNLDRSSDNTHTETINIDIYANSDADPDADADADINTNGNTEQTDSSKVSNNREEDDDGLYKLTKFNYDILIPFILINMHASSRNNILALLHTTLVSCIEGRCISEGFIKPETVRIVDFKCGKLVAKNVQFNLVIECLICNPIENTTIACVAKNITQAGIRAISSDEYLPVVVYISRDYSMLTQNTYYNTIKEGDKIYVRVIGKRFEMNDKFIQIIGELVSPKKDRVSVKNSKKLFTTTSTTNLGTMGELVSTSTSTSSTSTTSTSTTKTAPSKAPKEPKAPKVSKKSIKSNVDT